MNIDVKISGNTQVHDALKGIGVKAKAALVLTVNQTTNAAQQAIKDSLSSRFTLRRADFMRNTIYRMRGVDFATQAHPSGTVRINPSRDHLAKFEEGGTKVPVSGRTVAIPLKGIKTNKADIVTRSMRPRALATNPNVRRITTARGVFLVQNKRKYGALGARTEFLYRLKASVPIRPRLAFRDTATKAVDASFVRIALANLAGLST